MSAHLQAALDELTAKRNALNDLIVALQDVIGIAGQSLVTLPAPISARPARPRRVKAVRKPAKVAKVRQSSPPSDAAMAREQAILTTLKRNDGVASSKLLRAGMPKEAGLTDDQRTAAYRNCLHRLKVKGMIDRTGDTWSLVGAGSERA